MVANLPPKHMNVRKIVPFLFLALGLVAAGLIAAAPAWMLDMAIGRLRLAVLVPAAAPPIGVTGRTLLALAAGGVIAILGLAPLLAPALSARGPRRATRLGMTPPVRRADAHPDAPACRPIAARSELGAPLPADLDQPLAAFDPDALPAVPRVPVRPVAPLAEASARSTKAAREDWFETFPLPGASEVVAQPAASIATLLERLERGASRRAMARSGGQGLDDTLGALRKLAAN